VLLWRTNSAPTPPDQAYLLPQSPREWLPEGHLALLIQDTVGLLDLSSLLDHYKPGRGSQAYHPQMLLTALLYGYCTGVFSSRKIATHCENDLAFLVLAAGQFPDFRTISDFRKLHLAAFQQLFLHVLKLCREAGLVRPGASLTGWEQVPGQLLEAQGHELPANRGG